jgi:hypothetical protein
MSTFKDIDPTEIETLASGKTPKKTTTKDTSIYSARDTWPNPLEMFDLMDAIDEGRESVILSGKSYRIRYRGKSAFVQILGGYVPCGWFSEEDFKLFRKG